MNETKQPGININGIILNSSLFKREPQIPEGCTDNLNFSVQNIFYEDDTFANTFLKGTLVRLDKDSKEVVRIEVEYVGIFSVNKESPNMQLKDFCNFNSIALLYPFIRQHIHDVSLKAEIGNIIIPVLNLKAMVESKKD